jgi:hypothetical protein
MTTVQDLIDALRQLEPELPVGVFVAAEKMGAVQYEMLGVEMTALTRYTDNGQATAWIVANHLDHDSNDTAHLWSSRPRTWPIQHSDCGCYIETEVDPGQILSIDAAHDCGADTKPQPAVLNQRAFFRPEDTRQRDHNPIGYGVYRTS